MVVAVERRQRCALEVQLVQETNAAGQMTFGPIGIRAPDRELGALESPGNLVS
jgi:hypothetical protein